MNFHGLVSNELVPSAFQFVLESRSPGVRAGDSCIWQKYTSNHDQMSSKVPSLWPMFCWNVLLSDVPGMGRWHGGGHTRQCYLQELPHFGASFWQEKTAWRENQPPYFQIRQLRLRFEVLKTFLIQQKTQTEFFHELRRGNAEDITKFPQEESWQIEKYNLSKWCTWRTHRRNGSQQDVREDKGTTQFFKARGPYCPCSAAGKA